jgi:hypothetical protein
MPIDKVWPDKNTHDIRADEHDLLTPLEATIRLREELCEIDRQLAELDRARELTIQQRQKYESATARRELLSAAIERHGTRRHGPIDQSGSP